VDPGRRDPRPPRRKGYRLYRDLRSINFTTSYRGYGLDGFRDVRGLDFMGAFQVGDRAADFWNAESETEQTPLWCSSDPRSGHRIAFLG
jgi:hypothetical protein